MVQVKALVITGHGTNCEVETARAAMLAGADAADIVFFSDLTAGRAKLSDYNFLLFPGGFLDGDDLGAGQAAALRWRHAHTASGTPLVGQLRAFLDEGGIILGICNGFQLLVKLGLLPARGGAYFERQASLAPNESARFEDRWVHLRTNPNSPCVFTRGLDRLYLPVRHGEGRLIASTPEEFQHIEEAGLVALRYVDPHTGEPTMKYPHNPNGSPMGAAALTDPSGRVLGLMPHPEAYNHRVNHPSWTRDESGQDSIMGTALLEGGVTYLREQ